VEASERGRLHEADDARHRDARRAGRGRGRGRGGALRGLPGLFPGRDVEPDARVRRRLVTTRRLLRDDDALRLRRRHVEDACGEPGRAERRDGLALLLPDDVGHRLQVASLGDRQHDGRLLRRALAPARLLLDDDPLRRAREDAADLGLEAGVLELRDRLLFLQVAHGRDRYLDETARDEQLHRLSLVQLDACARRLREDDTGCPLAASAGHVPLEVGLGEPDAGRRLREPDDARHRRLVGAAREQEVRDQAPDHE
jgi:hypothetical protein